MPTYRLLSRRQVIKLPKKLCSRLNDRNVDWTRGSPLVLLPIFFHPPKKRRNAEKRDTLVRHFRLWVLTRLPVRHSLPISANVCTRVQCVSFFYDKSFSHHNSVHFKVQRIFYFGSHFSHQDESVLFHDLSFHIVIFLKSKRKKCEIFHRRVYHVVFVNFTFTNPTNVPKLLKLHSISYFAVSKSAR